MNESATRFGRSRPPAERLNIVFISWLWWATAATEKATGAVEV
jgi:hypothetical protein